MCQTLEKKLSRICLDNLNPSIELTIVDIDSKTVSLDIQMKYTNEVPVIVLDSIKLLKKAIKKRKDIILHLMKT